MVSKVDAASQHSATERGLSVKRAPPAGLNGTGGTTITAGFFLGAAGATTVSTTGAAPPVVLFTGIGTAVPEATSACSLHEASRDRQDQLGIGRKSRKRARPGVSTSTEPLRNKARIPLQGPSKSQRASSVHWDQQGQSKYGARVAGGHDIGANGIPSGKVAGVSRMVSSPHSPGDGPKCLALKAVGMSGGGLGRASVDPCSGCDESSRDVTCYTTAPAVNACLPFGEASNEAETDVFPSMAESRGSRGSSAGEPIVPAESEPLPVTRDCASADYTSTPQRYTSFPRSQRENLFGSFKVPGPASFLMDGTVQDGHISRSAAQQIQSNYSSMLSPGREQQRPRRRQHPKAINRTPTSILDQPPSVASGKPVSSQRLDRIVALYSNNIVDAAPVVLTSPTKTIESTSAAKTPGGKRAGKGRAGDQASRSTRLDGALQLSGAAEPGGGGGVIVRWRQAGRSSATVAAAQRAAERTRHLEVLMDAAMESPITYEEQVRRERLAHLRVMYTVEREMAGLPLDFLRGVGHEECGIKPRLSRMCVALGKSHRWSKTVALSRWAKALEKFRADQFSEDMLRYEHARLFSTLSSIRQRWELKQTRRHFLGWRRRTRLAHAAEQQERAKEAAGKIQRWARRRIISKRQRRAKEHREQRKNAMAREKANASTWALEFEDDRRNTLWRTLHLVNEKRSYEAKHRAATLLQDAWLRHVGRCKILEYAEMEREELRRRQKAERARRWVLVYSMVQDFLSVCIHRSKRAAIAKMRAQHEIRRLVYEEEMAEHLRVLNVSQALIAHAWRGKSVRLHFLAHMRALKRVQLAWKRSAMRWKLQAEIDSRVAATAERVRKARDEAARRLQAFAVKTAQRHELHKRFAARKAKLEFERRNRAELASACLVMSKPSQTIRSAAGKEDFDALGDAIKPAVVVARMRERAAARGISLSELIAQGGFGGAEDDNGDETVTVKQLSGSQLARAVLRQQETQRRAAMALQLAWRNRQAMRRLEKRFKERKVLIVNERQRIMAIRLQRMYTGAKLRHEVATRVQRTRLRIETQKDKASRTLQRMCRRRRDAKELEKRFMVRKIILEQARSLREMMDAASKIQSWYRRRNEVYYSTLRIVSRYQLAYKRAILAKEEYDRLRKEAAVAVQLAWRRRSMRLYLNARFEARRARIAEAKKMAAREAAAKFLQEWSRRVKIRIILKDRFLKRAQVMVKRAEEKERAEREDLAARLLQRAWVRHCEWEKMKLRFRLRRKVLDEKFALEESKRLELEFLANEKKEEERRLQREHETTKVKLLLEEAEKKRKTEEAADYLLKAWKLGYDKENSRNYWFNHVTGESSLQRPEGWTILPSERWQKQINDKGLTYYLDLETGESHWFPPCEKCYNREGDKVCLDCEEKVYCNRCWTMDHKDDDMVDHTWKGADSGKEDLSLGERHCVDCGFRKAKWVCLQCKDALCGECNARIHGSGHRKNHQVETYAKSKKGWQTVEGRTENEPTYYFNATTNESTFDKPEELMLPEELAEHKRFLEFKEISEKYVKKIEKLQFQLEELMYEKDKIAYRWANAERSRDKDKRGQENGGGLLGGIKFGNGGNKKNKKAKAEPTSAAKPEQEEAYKKSLLISRKDKKDMGFEVKLKK